MIPIEESIYKTKILKKLEMPFGNIYLLEDAVVSEIHYGVVGTAAQAKVVLEKALDFYERHDMVKQRVWIANKTHKYSVKLVGWIQMSDVAKKYLNGYCVVDNTKFGIMNAVLESKFVPINFKSVLTLDAAMQWVESLKYSEPN